MQGGSWLRHYPQHRRPSIDTFDITTLTVGVHRLRNLALATF